LPPRVDAAELRVAVAAVLAVAADGVHVHNLSLRSSLEAGSTRQAEKGRGGAEQRKKLRVAVWHGKQEIPVLSSRVSEHENEVNLPLLPHEP
jgi:hypothetical protein